MNTLDMADKPRVIFTSADGRTRIVLNPTSAPIEHVFHPSSPRWYVIERLLGDTDAMGVPQWRQVGAEHPARDIFGIVEELLERVGLMESNASRCLCRFVEQQNGKGPIRHAAGCPAAPVLAGR